MADDLQGTWVLASWYNVTEAGEKFFPLGPDATGYISYAADGHVFVHIAAAERQQFSINDLFGGTDAENTAAMESHVTYAGRFTRDDSDVLHHVTHASIPNWIGTVQRRNVAFHADGKLALSAHGALIQGQVISAFLEWSRADTEFTA